MSIIITLSPILPILLSPILSLGTMMAHTCLTGGLFHANHASNYLPIRARLPEDKEATLKLIDAALAGKVKLRSEWMRGL